MNEPAVGSGMVILYVADQQRAAAFYRVVLAAEPTLDVPGMTEFAVAPGFTLGLMPAAGIKRLLPALPDPETGDGIPRAELYLLVADPQRWLERALSAGATLLDGLAPRSWGDEAAYCLDPDAHVLAFATRGAP